jgi:hypothetical protein
MELPFFGSSQPGDTCYFSALKINVFDIVDCSIFGGKLSAHVYHEGVGKKGGNNVASLKGSTSCKTIKKAKNLQS